MHPRTRSRVGTRRRLAGLGLAMVAATAVLPFAVAGPAGAGTKSRGGSVPQPSTGGGNGGGQVAIITPGKGFNEVNSHYPGALIFPHPYQKPDITLPDTSGVPFNLPAQTQGYTTLVYFGYTDCPDTCPLTMYVTSAAVANLPPADRSHVKVVFETVDPAHDTGPVIRTWLDHFNPSFVGLTGTQSQIATTENAIGLPLSFSEGHAPVGGAYVIVHAGFTLAFTPDNKAHLELPAEITVAQATKSLEYLVEHGWKPEKGN